MFRRILVVLAVIVVGLAATAYLTSGTSTPPFTDTNGEVVPTAIVEERQMMIGGVEQYVYLRGRDRSAPILVHVHGGPGMTSVPFLRTFNAELENDFLVVYWDQRGTLKSLIQSLTQPSLRLPG